MYKKPTEKGINVWRLEYHEGYYAAGNGIKFDDKKSDAWKEGYRDGERSLYGDDDEDEVI